MPLYEELQTASPAVQFDKAAELIDGMRTGDILASAEYWSLVHGILANEFGVTTAADEHPEHYEEGEFTAPDSADHLTLISRDVGYLNAIAGVPNVESAIDAGTGSSAFLAVGTAVLHREANVLAVELNPTAAACAQRVTELLGVSGRVTVVRGDVRTMDLRKVRLGLTETYGPGFLREQGVQISSLLAQHAEVIVPAKGRVFAQDSGTARPETGDEPWYDAATLDFTEANDMITGRVRITDNGTRLIRVHAGIYTADDRPIVDQPDSQDGITTPITIGRIEGAREGDIIEFQYRAGSLLQREPPTFRQVG